VRLLGGRADDLADAVRLCLLREAAARPDSRGRVGAALAKAGVTSRAELAATLLREQYLPRRGAQAPSPFGWFLGTG